MLDQPGGAIAPEATPDAHDPIPIEGEPLQFDPATLAPSLEIAREFVAFLTGSPDAPIRVRMIHDSVRGTPAEEAEGTITGLWPGIAEWQRRGFGCFYVLNAAGSKTGDFARDQDIAAVRALAADFDKGLPGEDAWHLAPHGIVRTSTVAGADGGAEIQKGQGLWLVSDCPVVDFEEAQRKLAAHYGSDPSICNPSRVLRLPGTFHLKNPDRPQLVIFEDRTGGLGRDLGAPIARLLAGLSLIEGGKGHDKAAAPAAGDGTAKRAITRDELRRVLTWLDPAVPR